MSNILYWLADTTACGYYRCLLPGSALQAKGHRVIASETVDLNAEPGEGTITDAMIQACDVLVGQRIGKPGPSKLWQSIARAKGRSHPLVYELDDDVFALAEDPTNPNQPYWPERLVDVVKNLACSDAVTVSTAPLADVVSRFTSAPVHVVPNAIREGLIESASPRHWINEDTIVELVTAGWGPTIGWSGSATHDGDWAHQNNARSVARWLHARGRKAGWQLTTIGHPPAPLVRAAPEPWEIIPGQSNIETYYTLLGTNFDIGLAPLAPTRFNQSKSSLRLLELSALGIPWVASDVGPYGPDSLARGGLRVRRARDWWEALNVLTTDPHIRQEARRVGQEWARTRTVNRVLPLWESALGLPTSPGAPDRAAAGGKAP